MSGEEPREHAGWDAASALSFEPHTGLFSPRRSIKNGEPRSEMIGEQTKVRLQVHQTKLQHSCADCSYNASAKEREIAALQKNIEVLKASHRAVQKGGVPCGDEKNDEEVVGEGEVEGGISLSPTSTASPVSKDTERAGELYIALRHAREDLRKEREIYQEKVFSLLQELGKKNRQLDRESHRPQPAVTTDDLLVGTFASEIGANTAGDAEPRASGEGAFGGKFSARKRDRWQSQEVREKVAMLLQENRMLRKIVAETQQPQRGPVNKTSTNNEECLHGAKWASRGRRLDQREGDSDEDEIENEEGRGGVVVVVQNEEKGTKKAPESKQKKTPRKLAARITEERKSSRKEKGGSSCPDAKCAESDLAAEYTKVCKINKRLVAALVDARILFCRGNRASLQKREHDPHPGPVMRALPPHHLANRPRKDLKSVRGKASKNADASQPELEKEEEAIFATLEYCGLTQCPFCRSASKSAGHREARSDRDTRADHADLLRTVAPMEAIHSRGHHDAEIDRMSNGAPGHYLATPRSQSKWLEWVGDLVIDADSYPDRIDGVYRQPGTKWLEYVESLSEFAGKGRVLGRAEV